MNKEEIINIASEIGTYEISIEPYEDCCSYFVPLHPATSSNSEEIYSIEKKLKLNSFYQKLVDNVIGEKISLHEK